MMKKILLSLIGLLCAFSVQAQENIFEKLKTDSFEELMETVRSRAGSEDILVQMLFVMPPEYHQYVMPMIANAYGISEKTRMMPGIVEWRGKLPTRIAPEVQEYAKDNLRYLNPIFYPYLMPEAWPSFYQHPEGEHQMDFVPRVFDTTSADEMERLFPSSIKPDSVVGKMLYASPRMTAASKGQAGLTPGDVESVMVVFNKIKGLEVGQEGRRRRAKLVVDYKDQNLLLDALVNPCQSLLSRLDRIDADKWLEIQVQKENMTVPEYIDKCDRVIKAYRMRRTSPGMMRQVVELTQEAMMLPQDSYDRKVNLTIAHLFDTTREDVAAVKGQEDALHQTFKERLLILGTPVLLDF